MRTRWTCVLFVAVSLLGLPAVGRGESKPLFDGKSLDGWEGETKKTWAWMTERSSAARWTRSCRKMNFSARRRAMATSS